MFENLGAPVEGTISSHQDPEVTRRESAFDPSLGERIGSHAERNGMEVNRSSSTHDGVHGGSKFVQMM